MGRGVTATRRPAPGALPSALELRHLSKHFGPTAALVDIDLTLEPGEVHALCGHNGCGKSTVIKILAGYHAPEPGAELTVRGEPVALPIAGGLEVDIRFVHQDLGLVPALSVLDNFWAGRHPVNAVGRVRWGEARRVCSQTTARFGLKVPVDHLVHRLTADQRAILAIARAFRPESGRPAAPAVLVLDEPTALLPAHEVELLVQALRAACDQGVAVLLVTHRLDEVLSYADRVTVMRDGRRVATERVGALDHDALVELLLGRTLGELYPVAASERGDALLRLSGVSSGRARDVTLTVASGEIVGVTGLVGAGYDDVLYGVFGAAPMTGPVEFEGRERSFSSPNEAIAAGVGLLPADRLTHSGAASRTLAENLTLPTLHRYQRGPLLMRHREARRTREVLDAYDVLPRGAPSRRLSALSGGNQQKLLLAKWLDADLRLLLVHEPTQGVDIGAKKQVLACIADAARRGCGVIFASADYADLASLCHRVLVFQDGRIVAEAGGDDLHEERLAELCLRESDL